MAATDVVRAGRPKGSSPSSAFWNRRPVPVAVIAGAAFILTTGLRLLGLGRSVDIFGDEVYYRDMGVSVASGGFPRFQGGLFFLHPPGFFYLESGWQRLFGYRPDVVESVYEMRALNAVLAGATAVLLVVLVARVRTRPAAAAVAALFALDPFVMRVNDRVLLETATMLWVVAGYVVLVRLTENPLPRLPRTRAVLGGLLFGLAILTKDEAALITVLPLLLAVVLRCGPRRALWLLSSLVALLPYGVYVLVVAVNHHLDAFLNTKLYGLKRLLGLIQETGFNAPHVPPLSSRIAAESSAFASTFALLTLGVVAVVLLVRRGTPAQRLLALFHMTAVLALGYALAFGTLEEQELYLLLVPTMVTVTVTASLLARRARHGVAIRRTGLIAGLLVLSLGLSGATYAVGRSQTNTGYAQLRAYLAAHVPAGSAITTAGGPTDVILLDRYRVGKWVTPQERAAAHVRYAVVVPKLVEQGYTSWTPAQLYSLTDKAEAVFTVNEFTFGKIVLFQLPPPPAAPHSPPAAAPPQTQHPGQTHAK